MTEKTQKRLHPAVSVVIPTWNGEKFLNETIESVLAQTFDDYELILVDDASTDRTPNIAQEYEYNTRVVFYPHSDNLGLGGNWNRGLQLAKGTYIKILCQDDLLDPGYLESFADILASNDSVSLVSSFEQFVGESDRVRNLNVIPAKGELNGSWVQNHVLAHGNWIGGPTAVMFRRRDRDRVGMFNGDLPCGLDWEMWLRFLGAGNLYMIPRILFHSRIHGEQETVHCVKNLGFQKDRIRIMRLLEEAPDRYGLTFPVDLKSIWEQSVRNFIRDVTRSPHVRFNEALRFLNKYKPLRESWGWVVRELWSVYWNNRWVVGVKKWIKRLIHRN